MAPPGMEEMQEQLSSMFANLGGNRTKPRKLKVKEAQKLLVEEEAGKLVNEEELRARALANAEQNGIVFIDEIDKIARRQETMGADVSREGVQRDLLPLVEGSTVSTKYGQIKTDHILFIASGAFHMSKPSDLIPELQGRFPIRVELNSLGVDDFVRILTEPDASLTTQYKALHGHRERRREVRRERRAPHRRDRLQREREDREHRCAPAAHRDGAAARDRVVRRGGEWRQRASRSMPPMSTSISARSPRTRTWPLHPAESSLVKIAKPMLLVLTPIGVGWGLVEAWRFHWWLAVLMGVLRQRHQPVHVDDGQAHSRRAKTAVTNELLTSAAAERNKDPILSVLESVLPATGRVLEIASGTGQHVCFFAAALPDIRWQPTEPDDASREAISVAHPRVAARQCRRADRPRRAGAALAGDRPLSTPCCAST